MATEDGAKKEEMCKVYAARLYQADKAVANLTLDRFSRMIAQNHTNLHTLLGHRWMHLLWLNVQQQSLTSPGDDTDHMSESEDESEDESDSDYSCSNGDWEDVLDIESDSDESEGLVDDEAEEVAEGDESESESESEGEGESIGSEDSSESEE